MSRPEVVVRHARTADVRSIRALVAPLAEERVLVSKDAVAYFEGIQEFRVADAARDIAEAPNAAPALGVFRA